MKKSVLIIKLGYCETLVNEEGFVPSLGDVFRHTVLLHHYADYRVTWLTSKSAIPLLEGNAYIHELLIYEKEQPNKLQNRSFDEVLCLEKAPFLCNLAKSISAAAHFGFGYTTNGAHAHPGAESALDIANGKNHFLPIQALLYQMVGDYWQGEDYLLGYVPRSSTKIDIGLNFKVGKKWPHKSWPMKDWKQLAKLCQESGLSISWQKGTDNLYDYIEWIASCRLILTCDSLGMHLGLALKKKVIALFGPTPSENIHMYGRGIIMSADWACPESPCMKPLCHNNGLCMSEIRPRTVARTIINIIDKPDAEPQQSDDKTITLRLAS